MIELQRQVPPQMMQARNQPISINEQFANNGMTRVNS
jgi:hypothetical protein